MRAVRANRVRAEWRQVALHVDDEFPEVPGRACDLEIEPEPVTVLVAEVAQS